MPDRGDYSALVEPHLTYRGIKSAKHPDGHTYQVPMPDIPTGMRLASIGQFAELTTAGVEVKDDDLQKLGLANLGPDDIQKMTLGSAYDQMVTDGVLWQSFRLVFADAFAYFSVSPQLADVIRDRLMGEAEAPAQPQSPTSTPRTRRATAGSSSKKASTATRGRTVKAPRTRSSKSTRGAANDRTTASA